MKKFDSVKMMREIRGSLSKKYIEKPELEAKELEEIRKKYKLTDKSYIQSEIKIARS